MFLQPNIRVKKEIKEVTVLFDKNNVVSKITTSEKVEDVKRGLAH